MLPWGGTHGTILKKPSQNGFLTYPKNYLPHHAPRNTSKKSHTSHTFGIIVLKYGQKGGKTHKKRCFRVCENKNNSHTFRTPHFNFRTPWRHEELRL